MTLTSNLRTFLTNAAFGTAAVATSLLTVGCTADYSVDTVNACEQGVLASPDPYAYQFKARAAVATVATGHEAHIRFANDAFRFNRKTLNIADGVFDFGFRDSVRASYEDLINSEITIDVQETSGINSTVQTCTLATPGAFGAAMLASYNASVSGGEQNARDLQRITFVNEDWASEQVKASADFVFRCDGLQPLLSYFEMTFDANYLGATEAVPATLQRYASAADTGACSESHPDAYDWDLSMQALHVSDSLNDISIEATLREAGAIRTALSGKSNGNFWGSGKVPVRELEWELMENADIDEFESATLELKIYDEDDKDRLIADCYMELSASGAVNAHNSQQSIVDFSDMDCRTLDSQLEEVVLSFEPKVSDSNIVPVRLDAPRGYEGGPL